MWKRSLHPYPVPGIDREVYRRALLERFANPAIRDTLLRLGTELSDRIPKFVLPAVRDNLEAGRELTFAVAIVVFWARFMNGADEVGEPIPIVDRRRREFGVLAWAADGDPTALVSDERIFGDLAQQPRFLRAFLDAAGLIKTLGQEAIRALLQRVSGP